MSENFWSNAFQWTIWGLLMAAMVSGFSIARKKSESNLQAGQLHHTKVILVVGIVCFTFCAGILILSHVYKNDTASWFTDFVFGGFALVSLPMIFEYFRIQHSFTDDGLTYERLFVRGGFMEWSSIRSVKYSNTAKWFRLESATGDVARISAYLAGLQEFSNALLRHTPENAIDPSAAEILREIANGNPPSLWQ